MSASGPAILSCGEALIDFLPVPAGDGAPAFRPRPGGSPFNVAVAAARLGAPTGFLGRVSTDLFGDLLAGALETNGVDTGCLRRGPEPSTLAFVAVAADGEPRYAFFGTGAADRALGPGDLPADLPASIRCLHFGSFSVMVEPAGATLEGLMRREAGRRLITLDPNLRPALVPDRAACRARLERWLPSVDLVKVSAADLAWLCPGESPDAVAARWRCSGPAAVIVTAGPAGATVATARQRVAVPAVPTAVADTVGAGDSFQGALLAWLHRAEALDRARLDRADEAFWTEAAGFAARAAARTCARPGADPPWAAELA